MEYAVFAQGLTRRFVTGSGQSIAALDSLDLALPAGELVVLRGPSGCGKSTLLNLIGLLDSPSEGCLVVQGADLTRLDGAGSARFRQQHVGFLFQDAGLIEPMRVAENVTLPLIYRSTPVKDRPALVAAVLSQVGLEHRAHSSVSELSGGERQRVGLARALVSAPGLLLCDEPTAALDEANSLTICRLLKDQAAGGRSVICSSHDPVLIEQADRLISLRHGRLDLEAFP